MKKGQILVIAVIFMTVILVLTTSLFSRVANYVLLGSNSIVREQATNLAEAGVENTLWQLNQTAGACGNCQIETPVGTTGNFKVTITNKTSSLKTIESKGCIPNCTNPRTSKTTKVDVSINVEQISFRYAVQVGEGGVTMSNNARVNGTVYSNQNITGSNGSRITGDAYAAGTITSPNPTVNGVKKACPLDCQPISEMPDITQLKQDAIDAAVAGGNTNCPCTLSSGNIGPHKYTGNVTITNSASIILNGPVYITGNLIVSNNGNVNLNSTFGSNGTTMVIDGTVLVSNNGAFNPTSANPKGYILVVTNSASANAMSISNNGANAIFYALAGGAQLSNNSSVTALVAKNLSMSNNSILNYDSGLASAQFTDGPGGSWQLKKGTYRIQ